MRLKWFEMQFKKIFMVKVMNNINELAYIKFKQGFQSLTETALGRYYWNITLNCDCDLQHCYDIIEKYSEKMFSGYNKEIKNEEK